MKIKKVAALCKKSGQIRLYNKKFDGDNSEQYISDGIALYPLLGLPHLDESTVFTVLDFTEKEKDKLYFKQDELPGVDVQDVSPYEYHAEPMDFSLIMSGKEYLPIYAKGKIRLINTAELTPVSDESQMIEYYFREDTKGFIYVAVKAGMILIALIAPFGDLSEEQINQLEQTAVMSREQKEINSYAAGE